MLKDGNVTPSDTIEMTPVSKRLYKAMVNPENYSLSVSHLCEEANVSRQTYYRLTKDKEFITSVYEEQKRLFDTQAGNVLSAVARNAVKDDGFQYAKLYLTMQGLYADKLESKVEGTVDIGSTADKLSKYLKDDVKEDTEDSPTEGG